MNKTIKTVIAFTLICLLAVSCKNTNSPQAVTEKFIYSFVRMDYDAAKAISTKNTWSWLDIMASFTKDVPDEIKEENVNKLKIKITNTETESDSTVIVTFNTDPKILPFNKVRLQKQLDQEERERWKIDISTLDLIGNEDAEIEEQMVAPGIEMERQQTDSSVIKEE